MPPHAGVSKVFTSIRQEGQNHRQGQGGVIVALADIMVRKMCPSEPSTELSDFTEHHGRGWLYREHKKFWTPATDRPESTITDLLLDIKWRTELEDIT